MSAVVLTGRPGGTTHREVELLASLPRELCLIGGLAVMCRVGSPHRTTVDLDAVARGVDALHDSLARLALTSTGGGQYRFEGPMDLDVIDVAPTLATELAEQLRAAEEPLTDLELNVIALTWAHDTATTMDVVAVDEHVGERLAVADERRIATVDGLVAMKCTAIPLRASTRPEKRSSDLYDLARLLVQGDRPVDLGDVPAPLDAVALDRLRTWFGDDEGRDRTYREVRRFDEPAVDLDDVAEVVEDLVRGASP